LTEAIQSSELTVHNVDVDDQHIAISAERFRTWPRYLVARQNSLHSKSKLSEICPKVARADAAEEQNFSDDILASPLLSL
jgi:hypothetical protein